MILHDWLIQNNLSKAVFAKNINVSYQAVVYYINGKRFPNSITMRAIFNATGGQVTANDFYDLVPDEVAGE